MSVPLDNIGSNSTETLIGFYMNALKEKLDECLRTKTAILFVKCMATQWVDLKKFNEKSPSKDSSDKHRNDFYYMLHKGKYLKVIKTVRKDSKKFSEISSSKETICFEKGPQ